MSKDAIKFIQASSPDGGFLQSNEWRKFQESVGRKTFNISGVPSPPAPLPVGEGSQHLILVNIRQTFLISLLLTSAIVAAQMMRATGETS